MSDKEAVRLAAQIVRQAFGDLVGNIASILLNHGRLSLPELTKYSSLRPRSIQAILITLIQHNLVWHCEAQQGDVLVEYFEINLKECLLRLRWGRILEMTMGEFGDEARQVVQVLLTNGKLKLPDILLRLGDMDEKTKLKYTHAITQLASTSHILPTSARLGVAPFDEIYNKRKAAEKAAGQTATLKQLEEIRFRILDEIREERKEQQNPDKAFIGGAKRKANGVGNGNGNGTSSSKKQKIEDVINPKVYLRVNYERYNIRMRNDIIVMAAADRFNKPASYVVKAFLNASAGTQNTLRQMQTDPVIVHAVVPFIPEAEQDALSFGFGAQTPAARSKISELVAAYGVLLAAEDDMGADTADGVFLERDGKGGRGGASYMVALEKICGRLKRQVLEMVVEERWGTDAKRVFKIIENGNRLSENLIHQKAMLRLNDVRCILGHLHESNMAELQQISRGAERVAQRMIFLWGVDLTRATTSLLAIMYKTLANLGQRREVEIAKRKDLLEKSSRTDVMKDPTLLSQREVADLAELNDTLDKITVAEARTEMNVFILRDLPGGPQGYKFDDPFGI